MNEAAGTGNRLVLVVEDDQDISDMVQTYLEMEGFDVLVVGAAEPGLAALAEHRPAVAIVDARLPGRSGLELAREAKERGDPAGIIIYTAGMASEREAKAAGADAFVLKTAPLNELRRAVKALGARPRRAHRQARG